MISITVSTLHQVLFFRDLIIPFALFWMLSNVLKCALPGQGEQVTERASRRRSIPSEDPGVCLQNAGKLG